MWLFTAAIIVGVAILGIVLFLVLVAGNEAEPAPTAARAVLYVSSTTQPTATHTPTATATPIPTLTPTITPTPTPTPDVILLGVKSLGELSTVAYSLRTVVEKEARQPGMITIGNLEIWKPRLHFLLVASGTVKAGVDFAQMLRYEIVNNTVTVFLPAPRITDYAVDARSLQVYYIHTSFGLDEKFTVEKYNEAVVEAQESLRQAALDSDILDVAKTNATSLLQSLILGLGFSRVQITFMPPTGDEFGPLEMPQEWMLTPAPFITATPGG